MVVVVGCDHVRQEKKVSDRMDSVLMGTMMAGYMLRVVGIVWNCFSLVWTAHLVLEGFLRWSLRQWWVWMALLVCGRYCESPSSSSASSRLEG